jgi:hypothetical protein
MLSSASTMDRLASRSLNSRHDQHNQQHHSRHRQHRQDRKRVTTQLEKRGIPVRHGSRTAALPFDWEDPQTWAAAMAGVDKVYLTYCPDLAVPGSGSARCSQAQ